MITRHRRSKITLMKKLFILFFMAMLFGLSSKSLQAQITRGADTAEIYINSFWYWDDYNYHYGIFHSTNNGKDLTLQHSYIDTVSWCFSGKQQGSIYLFQHGSQITNRLLYSTDTGFSFEEMNDTLLNYHAPVSGVTENEIYIAKTDLTGGKLYRSTNNGISFICNNQDLPSLFFICDLGTEPGEI